MVMSESDMEGKGVMRPQPVAVTGPDGELDAFALFSRLTAVNALCRRYGFQCVQVSDLEGFSDCLQELQEMRPLVAVSDTSAGTLSTVGSPVTRRLKTVFMFMPHSLTDRPMERRADCFAVMREIVRQFMTVIIRQSTRLRLGGLTIDPTVVFEEIDQYFYSGGACAYYSITTERRTELVLDEGHWLCDIREIV